MNKKIGLVMTGGGARSAYQVGATRALYEITKRTEKLFEVITGNSAGAINSTYLASNAENWDVATSNLIDLWKKLKTNNVYDLSGRTISNIGLKWVSGTVLGGMTHKGSNINYFLDTEPLRKLASREINFDHIENNIQSGHLHGVALSTTNYFSGSNVVFFEGQPTIKDWARSDRFSYRTKLNIDHLMASSAIPFFFPPVKIGESFFGDGCIRQTTPLSPAIHLGAQKIIAVGVRYPHSGSRMQDLTFAPNPNPTFGQITGVMMNSIFMDSLESDVERLMRVNELIQEGQHRELSTIPILMLRPSRDLGKMTERLSTELPASLRYLLKGIGVSDHEGLDLLSYLAFDKSYTHQLIELGYDDTMRNKDEVLKFIDA